LTGANKSKRAVFCYDAANGKLFWTQTIKASNGSPVQDQVFEGLTYAGSTPVTDGQRLFAIFGNGDLASIGFNDKIDWAMNLGNPLTGYSHCTSLELYGNLLIVQLDQGYDDRPESRLLALDKTNGKTVWEKKGTEHPVSDSWSSPIVARTKAGDQLTTRGGGERLPLCSLENASLLQLARLNPVNRNVRSTQAVLNCVIDAQVSVDSRLSTMHSASKLWPM
jgi:outer membrane protein assembly factor BamB